MHALPYTFCLAPVVSPLQRWGDIELITKVLDPLWESCRGFRYCKHHPQTCTEEKPGQESGFVPVWCLFNHWVTNTPLACCASPHPELQPMALSTGLLGLCAATQENKTCRAKYLLLRAQNSQHTVSGAWGCELSVSPSIPTPWSVRAAEDGAHCERGASFGHVWPQTKASLQCSRGAQLWGALWRAPWLTGQREIGHLRIFLLPACGSYTCQGASATEDPGSQQQPGPPCSW